MVRNVIQGCAGLLLLASGAAAQTEYFPLGFGDQWIYRSPVDTRLVDVAGFETINGRNYAVLRGWFTGDTRVRLAEDGVLYAYDPLQNRERQWVAFGTPEGGSFETAIHACNSRAQVASRTKTQPSAIGEIVNAFEARYTISGCADAGLERELYAPYIGLVQRTETTIAGPRTYDLVYARLGGGVTTVSAPEVVFSLSLDRAVYAAGAPFLVRLTLRHSQPEPIPVTFSSSQVYELVIRNEKGDTVYRWSDGRGFLQVIREAAYPRGETNYVVPLGLQLAAGKYVAEGYLVTTGPRAFSASVGFEVK
ncbi:MAG: BsuPI-related putative proteinase inhibitor [Bryobacteraceae bacterium]